MGGFPTPDPVLPAAWDYLELEPLIKARLAEKVSGVHVLSAADLEGVAVAAQKAPALHVLYDMEDIPEGEGDRSSNGATQIVFQRWLVVVAVRNVADTTAGTAARTQAGPLLWSVIAHMSGWKPGDRWSPFRRARAPFKPGFAEGFYFVPTLWRTKVVTP